MKKGLVVEIKDKNTVEVMTPDFDFLTVKTDGRKYDIGDEIQIKTVIRWDRIIKYISAVAAVMVIFSMSTANLDKPVQVATVKEVEKSNLPSTVTEPETASKQETAPTQEPDVEPMKQEEPTKEKANKKNSQGGGMIQRKEKHQPVKHIEERQEPQPEQPQKREQPQQPDQEQRPEQPPKPEPIPEQPPKSSPAPNTPDPSDPIQDPNVPAFSIQVPIIGIEIEISKKPFIKPYCKWPIQYNEMNDNGTL